MASDRFESDLLPQAVEGDRAALAQLLLLHYDGLQRHIASRISGDLGRLVLADDILHQTFVRAAQAIGRYQPRHEGAFFAWLATIADNLIRDAEKRRRRERRAVDADQSQPPGQSSGWAALVERIAGDDSTPSARGQRRESARRVRSALAALPDDQREIVERYYLKGQSLDEVARAMGCTKGAVRASCYRARKRLRELMGRSSLYFSG
ncbi:MAG: sigma-70 family RNA polymerase sigma factor [Pirellulales bacterium]|nr:sigma-70 family RNA polymerase sigma factor [Pirellulales bacterium]